MKSESPRSAESQPLSSTPTITDDVTSSSGRRAPHHFTILIVAALYVLSGSTQPLLITLVKSAGSQIDSLVPRTKHSQPDAYIGSCFGEEVFFCSIEIDIV